jgi:hypothetical protein
MGNLCQALGIRLIAHKARNARATGSVEKARDILERDFEHGLRFCRVESIDELNRLARLWRMKFNRTAIHSRYGMARTDKWLLITEEQLVKAPLLRSAGKRRCQRRSAARWTALSGYVSGGGSTTFPLCRGLRE